jgi:hypothetical protein
VTLREGQILKVVSASCWGGYLDRRISGSESIWTGGYLDRRISGSENFWIGEYLDRRISGPEDIWIGEFLDQRVSGPEKQNGETIILSYWRQYEYNIFARISCSLDACKSKCHYSGTRNEEQ